MFNQFRPLASFFLNAMELEDLAKFKVCLLSLGLLFGLTIPRRMKQGFAVLASICFAFTYIPLMLKFFRLLAPKND